MLLVQKWSLAAGRLHDSIYEAGIWLRRALQDYVNYICVTGDARSLWHFCRDRCFVSACLP